MLAQLPTSMAYRDQDMERKRIEAEGERNRQLTHTNNRQKQLQLNADHQSGQEATARQYALDQSVAMQADPNTTRTVSGTEMTQTNAGSGSASRSASGSGSRLAQGGFGGNPAGPAIDGRYMSLVQAPTATSADLNSSTSPQVQMGQTNFTPPDAKAFQDAAFARLKDKSGALGQGAIQGLAAQLAGRGISGASGSFARGTAQEIANAVNPLADLNVAHLGQEYQAAQNAQGLSAQRDQAIYQGGIQQRGQDMSQMSALNQLKASLAQLGYNGGIQQRGQDLESLYRLL